MRESVREGVLPAVALLLALTAGACAGGDARTASPGVGGGGRGRGGDQSVPVTVATVVQKSMPIEIRVIGAVEAYSVVSVHAQITGQLTAVNFKEGDDVKKGQLLFALDRRPLEAALMAAQANLQRDIAQAANAKVVAQRYADLAGRGIATTEQLETSRASRRGARRDRRSRSRRGREREGPAAVRDHHLPDSPAAPAR